MIPIGNVDFGQLMDTLSYLATPTLKVVGSYYLHLEHSFMVKS